MACPNPKNFSGSDGFVDASFRSSRNAAAAAARALVPNAAKSSCIQDALAVNHCPADCPFPFTSGVTYTVTSVTTSTHWLFNISPFGWFTRIFDGHWMYSARAFYSYSGLVGCTTERWFAVADDIEVESELGVA